MGTDLKKIKIVLRQFFTWGVFVLISSIWTLTRNYKHKTMSASMRFGVIKRRWLHRTGFCVLSHVAKFSSNNWNFYSTKFTWEANYTVTCCKLIGRKIVLPIIFNSRDIVPHWMTAIMNMCLINTYVNACNFVYIYIKWCWKILGLTKLPNIKFVWSVDWSGQKYFSIRRIYARFQY